MLETLYCKHDCVDNISMVHQNTSWDTQWHMVIGNTHSICNMSFYSHHQINNTNSRARKQKQQIHKQRFLVLTFLELNSDTAQELGLQQDMAGTINYIECDSSFWAVQARTPLVDKIETINISPGSKTKNQLPNTIHPSEISWSKMLWRYNLTVYGIKMHYYY